MIKLLSRKLKMTQEEKVALVGKKKLITGNSNVPYTIKEIWEYKGFTLVSFEETPIVCNIVILKDYISPKSQALPE
jgi:hypothetical protein